MSVVVATWEAEARGFLELRNLRLQEAMIASLHSGLGDRDSVSKNKEKGIQNVHIKTFFKKQDPIF